MSWSSRNEVLSSYEEWIENNPEFSSGNSSSAAVYDLAKEVAERYEQELHKGKLDPKALRIEDVRVFALSGSYLASELKKVLEVIENSHLSAEGKAALEESFKTRYETMGCTKNGFFERTNRRISESFMPNPSEIVSFLVDASNKVKAGASFEELAGWLEEAYPLKNGSGEQSIMSEMLHVLAPEVFPITNSKSYELWELLIENYGSLSYPEKFKAITELRDSMPWWVANPNYRLFDVFGWEKESEKKGSDAAMDSENGSLDVKLNTILYGPPGTGKTYNTTAYAVAICEGKPLGNIQREMENPDAHKDEEGYETVKERFEKYKTEGRIAFVTFHQSYGYEDFIEGIRPILPCDDGYSGDGEIEYDVVDGVFKEISDRAREFTGNDDTVEATLSEDEVENIIEQYVSFIQESNDEGKEVPLKGKVTIIAVNRYKDGRPRSFVLGGSNTSHQRVSFNTVRRDFSDYCAGSIKSPNDVKATRGDKPHGNARYLFALYGRIQEFIKGDDYEQQPKLEKDRKNFVIIIDEINRGNISKIFGELITLIEEDKREGKGKENSIGVTLPHSPEEFYVPDNLYVLGTMNTADRSIALMDTALRRRFDFVEMMPDSKLVRKRSAYTIGIDRGIDSNVSVADIMEKMNARIEALYDREHTIGHSYFMGIEGFAALKERFEKEIIPLLQEYFYDDYGKIRLVLADSMADVEEKHQFVWERDIAGDLFEGMDSDLVPEKKIYGINNGTVTGINAFDDPLSYIKIGSMSEYSAAKG